MDNDVIIILSHTNSPSKVEILKQCITSLKKYGKKIILSTHSTFPEDVIEEVDYIVYDKENPIIYPQDFEGRQGTGFDWLNLGYYFHEIPFPNHAYCVLTLMKNGVELAQSLGYKNSHLIHYDCVFLDEDIINDNNNKLINYDMVCYVSELHKHNVDPNFMSVSNHSFLRTFKDINNKKDYAYNKDDATFETFLMLRFTNYNKTLVKPFSELGQKNNINIKNTGTHNGVVNEITQVNNYLDLVKDDLNNIYLNFRNNDNLKEIKINNTNYSIKPLLNLIKISDSDLNNGITISIDLEGYNFRKTFNNSNIKGYCVIKDTSQLNIIEL